MQLPFDVYEETDLGILLPIRWRNLYPGVPISPESSRETDVAAGTKHFVAEMKNDAIGCVTLVREPAHQRNLRMRWLGVDECARGHGIGSALAKACLGEASLQNEGIWCNARLNALSLYRKMGFEELGVPFELPGIGEHLVMRSS